MVRLNQSAITECSEVKTLYHICYAYTISIIKSPIQTATNA